MKILFILLTLTYLFLQSCIHQVKLPRQHLYNPHPHHCTPHAPNALLHQEHHHMPLQDMSEAASCDDIANLLKDFDRQQNEQTSLLLQQALKGTDKAISSAFAPLAARQESYQQKTEIRLQKLCEGIKSISDLLKLRTQSDTVNSPSNLSLPPRTPQPTEIMRPPDPSPNQDPTSPTGSVLSSTISQCSSVSRASLSSACRTLGFFPITMTDTQESSGSAGSLLKIYLQNILRISENQMGRLETKRVWFNKKKSMVYAEFYSMHMCQTIFKQMNNLQNNERVEKYIHPSLKPSYYVLRHKAYNLRHVHNYFTTRIDYTPDGLTLLCKHHETSPWTRCAESDTDLSEDGLSLSAILQTDGNDSIMTDTSAMSYALDENRTQNNDDLTFNYSLNTQNQARRLITGASRPPISVTYNNTQRVNDIMCTFYANVECSSGVYLTAIKPALEAVTEDWSINVGNCTVSCTKVSDRQDNTGRHLLSTQLKLLIPNRDQPDTATHKLTLHFYHTNDKIFIQSSTIMSPGTSAATWLVKNFIEPLAANHIENNQQSIDRVNNAILSSAESWSCWSCSCQIELTATQVKNQPLTCSKCSRMFHKKCTDRSRARGGNWNREPWVCTSCTASGIQSSDPSVTQPQARQDQNLITHAQPPVHAPPALTETPRPSLLQEDNSIVDINPPVYIPPNILNPSAIDFHPQVPPFTPSMDVDPAPEHSSQVPFYSVAQPTISTQPRRFPSNAIRQKSSNVAVLHPEYEFQKAAIDACRATIATQEADIKTLKESNALKNKKVMQLESQVGVATSYLASRDTSSVESIQNSDQISNLLQNLNLWLTKLSGISECLSNRTTPAVNVYASPCFQQHKNHMTDSATQTAADNVPLSKPVAPLPEDCNQSAEAPLDMSTHSEEILACTICQGIFQSSRELDEHMEDAHDCPLPPPPVDPPVETPESEVNSKICDYCSNVFLTEDLLQIHISDKHASDYIHCNSCMLRFQTKQKLEEHAQACHAALPPGTMIQSATCPLPTGSRHPSSLILPSPVQSTSSQSEKL